MDRKLIEKFDEAKDFTIFCCTAEEVREYIAPFYMTEGVDYTLTETEIPVEYDYALAGIATEINFL